MDDVITPDPKNPSNRNKAYKLRARVRRNEALSPEEVAWLADYEAQQKSTKDVGGSFSERSVHIEERAAAVGTGSAAEVAAAASLAREEGRRIDYLAKTGIDALVKSFEMQVKLNEIMMERMLQMEDVHLGMLGAVREQYLARTQAEVEAMQAQDGNEVNALLGVLLQRLQLGGGAPSAAPPTLPAGHRKPRRVNRRK